MHDGDTPTGDYRGSGVVSTAKLNRDSYGPWGAIMLKPVGGEALLAERLGRTGLLIHGGAEGRFDRFRSTRGCLRLHNSDMKTLADIVSDAGHHARVRITIREW